MASGGARPRSGPPADPTSGRSDLRGISFEKLPASGFDGEVPKFPLSPAAVLNEYWDSDSKQKVSENDPGASAVRQEREQELWEWAWSTPQACAWALEPWRWYAVGMWVRTAAICESAEAQAADKNSLHRFADQIGLTPAGLAGNGWAIARSELDVKRTEKATEPPKATSAPVRRMRAVNGDG